MTKPPLKSQSTICDETIIDLRLSVIVYKFAPMLIRAFWTNGWFVVGIVGPLLFQTSVCVIVVVLLAWWTRCTTKSSINEHTAAASYSHTIRTRLA